jgi:hypothetical protein
MSETELEDLDTVSAESICAELSSQIHALASSAEQIDAQFRVILRKVKHADVWDGETLELTPKPAAAAWLKAHGYAGSTIPYSEFITLFFSEAVALDIETQVICLKSEEAALFGVGAEATLYELLRNLPLVFV